MTSQVQITVELLEKLAGIHKSGGRQQPEQQRQQKQQQQQKHQSIQQLQPHRFGQAVPFGRTPPHLPSHPAEQQQQQQHQRQQEREQELQAVIQESKHVGQLLLKAEDRELAAVQQQADTLLTSFRAQAKPLPCGAERQAVLQCYREHGQDVLVCAGLIDAYSACAQQSAGASARG